MATLTKGYQYLGQTYIGSSYGDLYIRVYAMYSEQDIANNRSYVYYQARVYFSGSYIKDNQGVCGVSGTSANYQQNSCTYVSSGETAIVTTSGWVTHGSDGKCTVTARASLTFPNWSWSGQIDANADLPTIPRHAKILSAPNFTDEDNPNVTYSNPAGNAISKLQVCIAWPNGGIIIPYRNLTKTGSSYTFNFTETERSTLRKAVLSGSNTARVKFVIYSEIGGVSDWSNAEKTLTIVNANPTLNPTVIDVGSHSTTLTGDNTKFIKNYSIAKATINAVALKEASITSRSITCGNNTFNTETATIDPVESGTFTFSATDNRGNTVSKTIMRDIVDYVKLTCGLDTKSPDADGDFDFTVSGYYFVGNFGAVTNNLKVEYRYKVLGEDYPMDAEGNYMWTRIDNPTISDGMYNATVHVSGLDYQTTYVFQARAADAVYYDYIETVERSVKTKPVFDWSENDFNFNVPVFKEGNPMGYYPIGGIYTSSDNTDPGVLFGGTWKLERRFYGGELLAYGSCWNNSAASITCEKNANYGFSDSIYGATFASHIHNHMPDIIIPSSGTLYVQTKGVVGLVEATVSISGSIDTGCNGIWFGTANKNTLPTSVTLTGGGGLMAISGSYSGNSNTYLYNIADNDTGCDFFVNPNWSPYNGNILPSRSGTKSTLHVKAYAKGKVTYMWKRVA